MTIKQPIMAYIFICGNCSNKRKQEWQEKNKDTVISVNDWCKLAFTDGEETEHMWVLVTAVTPGNITGILKNEPGFLTKVKREDEINFTRDAIEDHVVE